MIALGWIVVGLWGLVLLASARPTLRHLPSATKVVPEYSLWLPMGGEVPILEPGPRRVIRGPDAPTHLGRLLVLGAQIQVPIDLPGRLAACGADFVSVFPMPLGGSLGLTIERLRRDVANPPNVIDPTHPAGFADPRCAWLQGSDLTRPQVGDEPVLRAARARKAHGLTVDLRDGRSVMGSAVRAPTIDVLAHRRSFVDLSGHDPLVQKLLRTAPVLLCAAPLLLLISPETRPLGLLALGLGSAARLMTAVRDGFGWSLPLLGWVLEPIAAIVTWGARSKISPPAFPTLPASAPPRLTQADTPSQGAWLDAAAVPFLARHLGGSAPVMEQIYSNQPAGRTALGRLVDRVVHQSPAARSVRHRREKTIELGQKLAPERLLSVPCGGAGDAAAIGAPITVLVDPGPAARRLAAIACPEAQIIDGTLERAPSGPFDLILYVGLSEYLTDAQVVQHLLALRGRLDAAGALLTTITAEHPQRTRMAHWLGWRTRARTPDAMAMLLDEAGYQVESRDTDPLCVQWVFLARPRPSAPRPSH